MIAASFHENKVGDCEDGNTNRGCYVFEKILLAQRKTPRLRQARSILLHYLQFGFAIGWLGRADSPCEVDPLIDVDERGKR